MLHCIVLHANIIKWTPPFSVHAFSGLYLSHCNWKRLAGKTWLEPNFQEFLSALVGHVSLMPCLRALSLSMNPHIWFLVPLLYSVWSANPLLRFATCIIHQAHESCFFYFPNLGPPSGKCMRACTCTPHLHIHTVHTRDQRTKSWRPFLRSEILKGLLTPYVLYQMLGLQIKEEYLPFSFIIKTARYTDHCNAR